MNRAFKIAVLAILSLTIASGLALSGCSSGFTSVRGPQVGKQAPEFQLPDLDGQPVSLSDFRGRPVLINFWASWCDPCRYEMPFIQEIYEDQKWSDKGLVILAIDMGESQSTVKEFMEGNGLSFTALLDISQDVALDYSIRAIPTTFLVDKNGVIQVMKIGAFMDKAEIEKSLGKIIP